VFADVSALKRSEARLQSLLAVSRLLSSSFDVEQTLASVVRTLVPSWCDLCFADVLDDDGTVRRVELAATEGARRNAAEALRRTPLPWNPPPDTHAVWRTAAGALGAFVTQCPEREAIASSCELAALLVAPMVAQGTTVGVIVMGFSKERREVGESDRTFASEVAARAASAIDSARLYRTSQRAIRSRQDLLTIVSHDLQNPLTGILLCADVMLRAAPPDERHRGRVNLENMKSSIAEMQAIIDDLLDVETIETGRLSVRRRDHDARELVSTSLALLEPLAREKRVQLGVRGLASALNVSCDAHRVLQVLSNLIGNAIKFTPPDGQVFVSTEQRGASICFEVRDTGPGLSKTALHHLFERNWRARERTEKGHGLGLYIAKGIVESHGGTIWAESPPGEGATFGFTLPAAQAGSAKGCDTASAPASTRGPLDLGRVPATVSVRPLPSPDRAPAVPS
jgi:signal transduction histidine kinase